MLVLAAQLSLVRMQLGLNAARLGCVARKRIAHLHPRQSSANHPRARATQTYLDNFYMSAVLKPEVRLEPLDLARLDDVVHIEQRAYSHPWTRGNFLDSHKAGYQVITLLGEDSLLGYFVAMPGVQEVHLLNITVDPDYQRQGWGLMMLDALSIWSRGQDAKWLWLEVRASNLRAINVYQRYGFKRVGERKNYYPLQVGQREHAVVMSLQL